MTHTFQHRLPGDPIEKIEPFIRVNHAGEYGAKRIYQGQKSACRRSLRHYQVLHHMQNQEIEHLHYFEDMMKKYKVRPTLMLNLWHYLSYCMGYITYKMSYESAMICTIAVEEQIIKHYERQIVALSKMGNNQDLIDHIAKFAKDEKEHLHIALDSSATSSNTLVYRVISFITKCAIHISTTY